jgi:hypothetical protein
VFGRCSVGGKGSCFRVQNTTKYVNKNSMSKTFPKKNLMPGFPPFFSPYRILGFFLSDGNSKTLQQTFTHKKIVVKSFYKKSINKRFFLDFILSRFWAFLGEGSI